MFPQPRLGTEAVVAEDAEQRTVCLERSLNPVDSVERTAAAQHIIGVNQDFSSLDVGVDVAVVVAHILGLWPPLLLLDRWGLGMTPLTSRLGTAVKSKPVENTGRWFHLSGVPVEKADHLTEFLIISLGKNEYSVLLGVWSGEENFLQKL